MLFGRRKQDDFSSELRSHLEHEADRLRAQGLSGAEADAAARRAFGNAALAQERFYESSRWQWWEHLRRDVQYALRTLGRSPGFTAAAVLTVALGIGGSAAIFSVIDAAMLRPLPYPAPERLAALYIQVEHGTSALSPADFLDYQREVHSFQGLAAYRDSPFNVSWRERPERVNGAVVTPDFFAVMGVQARLGRALSPELDAPGKPRAVVVSDSFWRNRLGANPACLGQTIRVDGEPLTVAGVMPESFRYPPEADLWVPARFAVPEHVLRPAVDQSAMRDTHYFNTIARVKPGVTLAAAQTEADVLARNLQSKYGGVEEGGRTALVRLDEDMFGETRPALMMLLSAVLFLLLIACANVTNLLLARGAARQKEIAIRAALGAARGRLVRQLLTESLILAATGCALGVGLAYGALHPVAALLPVELAASAALSIDWRVLAFTAALAIASGILFGVFPALSVTKARLNVRGSSADARAHSTRKLIVIGELALTAVLLISAGLLVRSFGRLLDVPAGFKPEHVLSARISLPPGHYSDLQSRRRMVERVIERLGNSAGVSSAAVISRLPLQPGRSTRSVQLQGRAEQGGDISPDYLVISPAYFRTMGIRILRGREFTERDDAASRPVVIVNETMARAYWPGRDAIGQLMRVGGCGSEQEWCEVVGVAEDVQQHGLGQHAPQAVYVPYARDPWTFLTIVVRTPGEPALAASAVVSAVQSVDPEQPVYGVRAMHDVVMASLAARRARMLILIAFAVVALALACVGIYGVVAYSVTQRVQEIGIRMALGAGTSDVLRLVIGQGLQLAATGVAAGLVLAAVLTRFLSAMLYAVKPTDAISFSLCALLLIGVTVMASYIPARRASKVDAAVSLRVE